MLDGQRTLTYVRLGVIEYADINAKEHDIPHIVASMQEHGFAGALLVDERTKKLIAGHGRHEALTWLKRKNQPRPEGILEDVDGEWLVPVLRGWTSKNDIDAMALNIRDNKLTTDGGWNNQELAQMLEEIVAADAELFDAMGFTAEDIDALLREYDPDLQGDPEGEGGGLGGEEDDVSTICCPACGHRFNNKL